MGSRRRRIHRTFRNGTSVIVMEDGGPKMAGGEMAALAVLAGSRTLESADRGCWREGRSRETGMDIGQSAHRLLTWRTLERSWATVLEAAERARKRDQHAPSPSFPFLNSASMEPVSGLPLMNPPINSSSVRLDRVAQGTRPETVTFCRGA